MDINDSLLKIIQSNIRVAFHFGVVTALTDSNTKVSIKVAGSDTVITGVAFLDSYAPAVDDVVFLVVNKGDIVVLGKLASAGSP